MDKSSCLKKGEVVKDYRVSHYKQLSCHKENQTKNIVKQSSINFFDEQVSKQTYLLKISRIIFYGLSTLVILYQIIKLLHIINNQISIMKCPYNQAHIMPKQSFLNHLRKCQATNKKDFIQCKYDLFHIVRKQIIQKHYLECPAKLIHDQNNQEEVDDWNELADHEEKEIQSGNWGSNDPGIFEDLQEKGQRKGRNGKNAAPNQKRNYKQKDMKWEDWNDEEPSKQVKKKKNPKPNKGEQFIAEEWTDKEKPFQLNVSVIEKKGRREQKKANKSQISKEMKQGKLQKPKKKKQQKEQLIVGEWEQ